MAGDDPAAGTDADDELPAAMRALRADPALGELVEATGPLSIDPAADPFERLVVSIVNQQLSTASAAAIRGRLFDRFEVTPRGLQRADEDGLREVGLSGQKIRYLRNVARAFEGDGFTREALDDLSDEAVVEELTAITGVGEWTANMFLMRLIEFQLFSISNHPTARHAS